MTWKRFFVRLLGLIVFAPAGWMLFAATFNTLIFADLTPEDEAAAFSFAKELTFRAAFVFMGSLLAGFAGVFMKDITGRLLYLSPLYAPSLFAIAHALLLQ